MSVFLLPAYAKEMGEFIRTSDLTKSKAFLHSFVTNISVKGHEAVIHYMVPVPDDSPISQTNTGEIDLGADFRSTAWSNIPDRTVLRTFLLRVNLGPAGHRQAAEVDRRRD